MEVFQYVLLGIAAAILALFVKSQRPEIALTLSLSAGIMLFLLCLGKLAELTGFAAQLAEKYGSTPTTLVSPSKSRELPVLRT